MAAGGKFKKRTATQRVLQQRTTTGFLGNKGNSGRIVLRDAGPSFVYSRYEVLANALKSLHDDVLTVLSLGVQSDVLALSNLRKSFLDSWFRFER